MARTWTDEQRAAQSKRLREAQANRTKEERQAIARMGGQKGGPTTAARHGREHYSKIGKVGFQRALETIGGHTLYEILGKSYRAKYGRDPVRLISKEELQRREQIRAEARRTIPTVECVDTRKGACAGRLERDHVLGLHVEQPNAHVEVRCHEHHVGRHREAMAAKRKA